MTLTSTQKVLAICASLLALAGGFWTNSVAVGRSSERRAQFDSTLTREIATANRSTMVNRQMIVLLGKASQYPDGSPEKAALIDRMQQVDDADRFYERYKR